MMENKIKLLQNNKKMVRINNKRGSSNIKKMKRKKEVKEELVDKRESQVGLHQLHQLKLSEISNFRNKCSNNNILNKCSLCKKCKCRIQHWYPIYSHLHSHLHKCSPNSNKIKWISIIHKCWVALLIQPMLFMEWHQCPDCQHNCLHHQLCQWCHSGHQELKWDICHHHLIWDNQL